MLWRAMASHHRHSGDGEKRPALNGLRHENVTGSVGHEERSGAYGCLRCGAAHHGVQV
jgi:hypothetical protein